MEQKQKNRIAYIVVVFGIIAFCVSFFFLPIPENSFHSQTRSLAEQKNLILQLLRIFSIIGLIMFLSVTIYRHYKK